MWFQQMNNVNDTLKRKPNISLKVEYRALKDPVNHSIRIIIQKAFK